MMKNIYWKLSKFKTTYLKIIKINIAGSTSASKLSNHIDHKKNK